MANTIGLQAIVDVTQFNQGLRLYIKGMLDMTQATTQASTQINRLGVAASAGLGAALGTTAVNAASSFISVLRGMAAQVGENISSFQSLGLALNYFTARALQEDQDIPLAEALKQTRVEAQGLLLWVERLATLSPFTAEQVGNALRTAQAYGLSLAAAQKLVPLLVDFAAVNNLSAELLQRVALAISQIQARGKLASQEINQLANAGLPIRSLLVKALNVTAGELEKMLEDGLIPAGVAIQAVTDYLEGFGGAAEQVTRGTLRGVLSSLQDIRDITSRDLFGPMIASFFPFLNQLIDLGNSTQFKAGVKVIGQELGEGLAVKIRLAISQVTLLVQSISSLPPTVLQATAIFVGFGIVLTAFTATVGLLSAALGVLINPFTLIIAAIAGFIAAYSVNFRGLRDITTNTVTAVNNAMASMARTIGSVVDFTASAISSVTTYIGSLADTVVQYGSAVVESFAVGITSAMGFVVDAMQFLGQVLQFWLAPGSPPRVAPELDKWGTGSANEWLKGWLKADFDILSSISRDIGSVLGALVSAGQLDELSAPRILRALRTELAAAVGEFRRFGNVSEATLNRVAQSAGPAAEQVRRLFRDYVALAAETQIVKQAQESLNAITERYDAILSPIRKKLSDISELRQQADEQKEILSLQRLLANSGVSEGRKQAARLRIQEIATDRQIRGIEGRQEAEETAAEKELKAAEKRRDLAEENLDRTKALIEVQNEQLELYGEELQILEKIRKEQERLAREARQRMLEQLRKQLEIAQLLQAELRDTVAVFKAQYTLADASATAAEKAAASLELQAVLGRRIVRNFEAMELGIDPSTIQDIRDTLITLEDIGIKGDSPFDDFEFGADGALEDVEKLVKEMNEAMQDIREMFSKTREDIDGFLQSIDDMLPSFLKFRKATNANDTSTSDLLRTTRAATDEFKEWPPLFKTLATAFSGIGAGLITSKVLTALPKLLLGLGGPVGIVSALVSVFASAWTANWFNIREVTDLVITKTSKSITSFLESDQWGKFAQDVSNNLQYAQDAVLYFGNRVREVFEFIIQPITEQGFSTEAIQQSLDRLHKIVMTAINRLRADVSDEAKETAQTIAGNISSFLEAYWNPFLAILILNTRTIVNVFATIFQEILKAFGLLPTAIGNVLKIVVFLFGKAMKLLLPIVVAALQPINNLILASLGGLGRALAAIIVSPFKLLGKLINLNTVISFLVTQFTTGFSAQLVRQSPKMWQGLLTGLIRIDALIGNTIVRIFSGALGVLRTLGRGYLGVFQFLDNLSFRGFEAFTRAGIAIPKILTTLGQAFRVFGGVALKVVQFVSDAILSLVVIDYKPIFDFFNRIKPTATATMPILAELFDLTRVALGKLTTAFAPAFAAFKKNVLPIFTGGFNTSGSLLNNIQKLGAAIGGKFVTVFQQFKGVGPTVAAAFKGIGAGLRNLSLTGSIKILDFFEGLSKGILSFAGKGQAKLGNALAGIFQGAFKGITKGIIGAPKAIFSLFRNINVGGLLKGFGSLFGSIKKVSGAFGGFLNPLNLIIAALDFFGFAFRNNIDGVENQAQGFIDNLRQFWADLISGKIWSDIVKNASGAFAFIQEAWAEFQTNGIDSPRLREMLAGVGMVILEWVKDTGANLLIGLREFWLPMFGLWITESIENLGTTLGQILIFVRDFLITAGTFLGGVIAQAWSFFWTWWSEQGGQEKTLEWLNGIITLIWGWITTSATFLYDNFIANWLPAFVNWLTDGGGLQMMLTKLLEFLGGIGKWIIEVGAPWLTNVLLTWATAFVSWLGPALGWAIENLGKLLGAMITWIIGTGVPLLIGGVIYLVKALVGWISGDKGSATEQAPTKLQEFLDVLGKFFTEHIGPALLAAGKAIAQGLWDGFVQLWATIMETGPAQALEDFLVGVQTKIIDVRAQGLAIAKNIIDGIVEGFTTYVTEPYEAFKQWILGLVGAGEEAAETGSPSELTKRLIGTPLSEGIIEGIKSLSDNPIFKTIANVAKNGFGAFHEEGMEEGEGFSLDFFNVINDLYETVLEGTDLFVTTMVTKYQAFANLLVLAQNALAESNSLSWQGIKETAMGFVQTMTDGISSIISIFGLNLQSSMTLIKGTIVNAFTLANTEATTEAKKLAASILGVLVGKGENDQTSATYKIKEAMTKAGKSVGKAFIDGLIFVFTDTASLNPLWVAIDSLVDGIVTRFQTDLAVGSPSKVAANAIGKPIAQGIGMGLSENLRGIVNNASKDFAGMINNNMLTSPIASRPGTFLPSNVTNVSHNNTYSLTVNSGMNSQGLVNDFGILKTLSH